VAKVVAPVTASIEGQPANISIAAQGQEIPAIIVAENKKEAIDASASTTKTLKAGVKTDGTIYWIDGDNNSSYDPPTDTLISASDAFITSSTSNNQLMLEFPLDVLPSMPSKVEVIEGDIVLDMNSIARGVSADGRWNISVTVKSTSSVPSKIKFSGIKLTLARTVPEGPLNVAVKGSAVVQTISDFPGYTAATVVKVANVVTPAPGEQKAKVVFTINNTKYTVNGVEQNMDVAPYIKDGRTFVPVRYAAQAVGVTPENILYSDGKVTLIKGDKVVQLTIGSNVMLINGIAINMDVAAEISNDRTMLPFRWVAQALGAKVNWDEATQTVTMEL
jgi:hypothetical protein